MKITIETPKPGEPEEIIIKCNTLNDKITGLISALKSETEDLTGYVEDKIVKLVSEDIFYFEAVDNKNFAYTKQGVYEVHKKLYEIENEYTYADFLRISKSVIVNVAKIAYVRPIFNSRFEATLKNNEKVIISRQYVSDLKEKLGI